MNTKHSVGSKTLFKTIVILLALWIAGSACQAHSNTSWHPLLLLLSGVSAQPEHTIVFTDPGAPMDSERRQQARNMIVTTINNARSTLQMHVYGLDDPFIINALSRARSRGVELSIVGSSDRDYTLAREEGLVVSPRIKSGLQHQKVILADNRVLISGTGNFTVSGLLHNNNAFLRMKLSPDQAELISHSLAYESAARIIKRFPLQSSVLFSPLHGRLIQSRLIQDILNARFEVRVMMFSFTDPLLVSALAVAAQRGVTVEAILNDEGETGTLSMDSVADRWNRSLGALPSMVYLDGNRSGFLAEDGMYHGGKMHHKTLIIDRSIVVTGSYNWSMSARDSNSEILFRFHSPLVAEAFLEEFNQARSEALLLPRPPIPLEVRSEVLFPSEDTVCLAPRTGETRTTTGKLTVFSSRGAFFQTVYFQDSFLQEASAWTDPATGKDYRCLDWRGQSDRDGGIASRSTHPFPLLPSQQNTHNTAVSLWELQEVIALNTRTQGMESPQQSDAENLCSKQCTVTRPVLFDGPAGLVWLREDALTTGEASRPHPIVPDEIRIWHRDGLSEWLTLTPVAENYYRFVSPCPGGCGDSLAFLRGSTNVAGEDGYAESLFCQQEGSTISRPIRDLVDSLYYTDRLMDESPCSP